jgi:DNA polymerase-3 subunit delta
MPKGAGMIYFYYGEDELGIKRKVDVIKKTFAEKYGRENIAQINAAEAAAEPVLSELVNIGLFSMNRLVIMNNLFINKLLSEQIVDNLPRVHEQTDVVIIEPKPDKRLKLFKTLVKDYKAKQFALDQNVSGFVAREAEQLGAKIDRAGTNTLIDYTGGDRWRIVSELKKLAALDQLITVELISQYVEPELDASAFNLLDDLLAGKRQAALDELEKLRVKEDATKFFGLLASQVFALSAVVNAGSRSHGDIAKDIGVHPYAIQKLSSLAKQISKDDVKKYSRIISETDEQIKSSKVEAWTLIRLAISKF